MNARELEALAHRLAEPGMSDTQKRWRIEHFDMELAEAGWWAFGWVMVRHIFRIGWGFDEANRFMDRLDERQKRDPL